MTLGVRLGLDWGSARIGVAASDPEGSVAFPVGVVPAGRGELERVLAVVAERRPAEVVVGLPLSLSGREGPAAVTVRERARALAALLPTGVGVRLVDERLTTVTAAGRLRESGRSAKQQRGRIDAEAAVAILQHALAGLEAGNGRFGELVSPGSQPSARPTSKPEPGCSDGSTDDPDRTGETRL